MNLRKPWSLWCLLAAVAALTVGEVRGEDTIDIPKPSAAGQGSPADLRSQIYTHPKRGFTVAVPPSAQVLEKNEQDPQISIRSRKGYVINVQAGTTKRETPLAEMSRFLEERYLGEGKPWTSRGAERRVTVAGLPGHEVQYEGNNTRARVIIVRGQESDFVFIFFAAEREFQKLEHEFDWVLTHFRPGPNDLPQPEAVFSIKTKEFSHPGYGFTILYPADWVYTKPAPMTAMFSGKEGSAGYSAIVSVQNVASRGAKDSEDAARMALADLRNYLAGTVRKLVYLEDRPWLYERDDLKLNGREVVMSYVHAGQRFQKRIVVVPRPFQAIAHIWSYTAPVDVYPIFNRIAERMLKSWTVLTSTGS